jgi:hypothetical protein
MNMTTAKLIKRQFVLSSFLLFVLVSVTTGVVLYANGYRFSVSSDKAAISKTGILNASSVPKGAQVYIDGHLTSATDNAINLTPGKYEVTIAKDGYNPWKKDVQIQEQLVSEADAVLFPSAPSLQSISSIGVLSPTLDPSGTKLAFRVASQSAVKNGIYVLDMSTRSFPVLIAQSASTQIVTDATDLFSTASLSWSPDGTQILARIPSRVASNAATTYLLDATTLNAAPRDVTATLSSITSDWQTKLADKKAARLASFNPNVRKMIMENMHIIAFSPDDTKILYEASMSATLPVIITPRRIGNNLLYETRDLKKGGIYVFDLREDINTKVMDTGVAPACMDNQSNCAYPLTWMPDSSHLLLVHDKKISIMEDDGSNQTLIYAGPFVEPYVYPWPDGSKLVVMTNLNNTANPPTFYTISLR